MTSTVPEVNATLKFHYDQNYKGDKEKINERTLNLDQLTNTFHFTSKFSNGDDDSIITRDIAGKWTIHIDNPGYSTVIDMYGEECNNPNDKGKRWRETVRGSLVNPQTINGELSRDSMHVLPDNI
jgi:hypothetical protein